jgi:hypothetical protein
MDSEVVFRGEIIIRPPQKVILLANGQENIKLMR